MSPEDRFNCMEVSPEDMFHCMEVSPEDRFNCTEVSLEDRLNCTGNYTHKAFSSSVFLGSFDAN